MLRQSTVVTREQILRDIRAIVLADLAAEWDLEELARCTATSRRQVQRIFADQGTTWREWLCEQRMRRAAELLAGAPFSVREVALGVGYRQPAQFAKAFRRVHGVSPSEFQASAFGGSRPADTGRRGRRERRRPTPGRPRIVVRRPLPSSIDARAEGWWQV